MTQKIARLVWSTVIITCTAVVLWGLVYSGLQSVVEWATH